MAPSSFSILPPTWSSSGGTARHSTSSYLLLSTIAIISAVAVGWWVQCKTSLSFRKEISNDSCNDDRDDHYSSREKFRARGNEGVDSRVPVASCISSESQQIVMCPQKSQREQYKERRRLENLKHFAMKKTMYDNICMLCPEGERLSTVSKKKATWYVEKGLARWIDNKKDDDGNEDPPRVIQLLFEPKCRSSRGSLGTYINAEKINQCVVCGETSNYMRHYIVPYAYRTLLPTKFKSHLSHDIVILCFKCNHKCERQKQVRMNDMEETIRMDRRRRAGRSYNEDEERAVIVDKYLYQVRSYAMALLKWKGKLPDETIMAYEATVRAYLSRMKDRRGSTLNWKDTTCVDDAASSATSNSLPATVLTPTLLQQAIDIPYCVDNPNYITGPQLVVQDLNQDDRNIEDFIKDWRRHFLRVAKPRFLPAGWSVHSPVCFDLRNME
jgi:hypothetical protein